MAQASEAENTAIPQTRSVNAKAGRHSPGLCIQCASFDSWYVKSVPNRAPNCPKLRAALVFRQGSRRCACRVSWSREACAARHVPRAGACGTSFPGGASTSACPPPFCRAYVRARAGAMSFAAPRSVLPRRWRTGNLRASGWRVRRWASRVRMMGKSPDVRAEEARLPSRVEPERAGANRSDPGRFRTVSPVFGPVHAGVLLLEEGEGFLSQSFFQARCSAGGSRVAVEGVCSIRVIPSCFLRGFLAGSSTASAGWARRWSRCPSWPACWR